MGYSIPFKRAGPFRKYLPPGDIGIVPACLEPRVRVHNQGLVKRHEQLAIGCWVAANDEIHAIHLLIVLVLFKEPLPHAVGARIERKPLGILQPKTKNQKQNI
jgi:hypothetical protein